jgi:hypothetical protein
MGIAASAPNVAIDDNVLLSDRLGESWPPGPGVVLGIGIKKRGPAANAAEDTIAMEIVKAAHEGQLGIVLPCNGIRVGRKQLPPLRIGLLNGRNRRDTDQLAGPVELGNTNPSR